MSRPRTQGKGAGRPGVAPLERQGKPPSVAGRVPPHDLDAEAAVLSAMLLSGDAVRLVLASPLCAEHFYSDANGRIHEAIGDLAAACTPVDIVSVAAWLRGRERLVQIGGPTYLAQLADATPAVAHVEAHAAIVIAKHKQRSLIAISQRIAAEGYGDVGDVDVFAEACLTALRAEVDASTQRAPLVLPTEAVAELVASWEKPTPFAPTGLPGLDRLLSGGLRPGNVIGLAGAAKAGKSALAGQVLYDAVGPDVIGIYASVEMPRREVWARWITRELFRLALAESDGRGPIGPLANFGEVFYGGAYRSGRTRGASAEDVALLLRLGEAAERARSRPNLYVENLAPGSTPMHLRALARKAREEWTRTRPRAERPLVVMVVDPVQRLFAAPTGALSGSALERVNADEIARMGQVAQQLKVMADEDGIAIVFPSDGTKSGAGAGPQQVSDLRGNYQLNHLATTILGLHSRKPKNRSDPLDAARALAAAEGGSDDEQEARATKILGQMPPWWQRWAGSEEALRFGPRPIAIDCSGNRQADASDLVLAFVRGACAFIEGEGEEDITADARRASPAPLFTSDTAKPQRRSTRAGAKRAPVVDTAKRAAGDVDDQAEGGAEP